MGKVICKPKDRVATEDKNNTPYDIDCNSCKAVYFDESKRSLNRVQMNAKDSSGKNVVKRMKLQNSVGKQVTTLAGIRRKLLIGKGG